MIKLTAILPLILIAAPAMAGGQFRALPVTPVTLPGMRVILPVTLPARMPAMLPVRLPGIIPAARPGLQLPSPDVRLPFAPKAILRIVNAPTAFNLAIAFDNVKKPEEPAPVAVPAPAPADLVKSNGGFTLPEQDLLKDIGVGH